MSYSTMTVEIVLNFLKEACQADEVNEKIEPEPFISQPTLVQACFHGDPDEVRALLYKKEDINYQVNHFFYALLSFLF